MRDAARRAFARVDDAVELRLDHLRGNRFLDRLFYGASELGDWSLIWFLVGLLQALLPGRNPMSFVRLAVILGAESALVNGPIKQIFRRGRPQWTAEAPRPHRLRTPRTSSFPSGHASAAFCAAGVLSAGGDHLWPVYYAIAVVVASSRCFVRIHHASDVLGGAVLGVLLGLLANHAWAPFT
jgi:membrane-associated phospholipid phosphatase